MQSVRPVRRVAELLSLGVAEEMSTRRTLPAAACDVAAYFRAHGAYGSEAGALRALRRRAPGKSPNSYQRILTRALALYDTAVKLVARDARKLTEAPTPDFSRLSKELAVVCPGFSTAIRVQTLHWVLFWHHLK